MAKIKIIPVEFKNNLDLKIRGFVHEPDKYENAIINLHGFPGSMTGTSKRMCNSLSGLGYLAMRFDFSGSATSEGKFEDKLMSQEVRDIKYAIDFLKKNYKFKKLILIGHSTGAIDASLYCSKDKRINKTILMAPVFDLGNSARYDFTDRQVHDFWTKGFITYKTKRKAWLNNKKLKKAFYDEFFKLDIPKSIKRYRRPLLIIHGTKDEAIPVEIAKQLFQYANKPKKLVIVKNANHGFKNRNHWKTVINAIHRFSK